MPQYDDDIDDSFASLKQAETLIGKEFEIIKKKTKDQASQNNKN